MRRRTTRNSTLATVHSLHTLHSTCVLTPCFFPPRSPPLLFIHHHAKRQNTFAAMLIKVKTLTGKGNPSLFAFPLTLVCVEPTSTIADLVFRFVDLGWVGGVVRDRAGY